MKIAFVSQPWNFVGQSETRNSIVIWTEELTKALAPEHQVLVYSRGGKGIPARTEKHGVHHLRFRTGLERRWQTVAQNFAGAGSDPLFARSSFYQHYLSRVCRDLVRQGPDLVHVMNFGQFIPPLRHSLPRSKLVLHMHCEWISTLPRHLVSVWLESTDLVIFCSEYLRERATQSWPDAAERFLTVPNGVDLELFRRGDPEISSSPRLLFVGRLSPEKGIHDLLAAMPLILEQYPKAHLDLVGALGLPSAHFLDALGPPETIEGLRPYWNASYPNRIRNQIHALGDQVVDLPGTQAHAVLPRIFSRADLLVNPSLSESFGMSLIEALAVGIPVVATRVGGQVEILRDCPMGSLVSPAWPEDLGRGIVRALARPAPSAQEKREAREQLAERYSWGAVLSALLSAYATVSPPSSPPRV